MLRCVLEHQRIKSMTISRTKSYTRNWILLYARVYSESFSEAFKAIVEMDFSPHATREFAQLIERAEQNELESVVRVLLNFGFPDSTFHSANQSANFA